MGRSGLLDEFYGLMADLEERCDGPRELGSCDGRMQWPRRGVYFFFEDGELREDGKTLRVVRVGTHALRPSSSTLWGRLAQHRGTVTGRSAGGGNHRGSVFRLHVGTALLDTGHWPLDIRQTWGSGGSADPGIRLAEVPLERSISDRIGRMPLLWLEVDDPPGSSSDRGLIERGAIALLSNHGKRPIDGASPNWLGAHAAAPAIRSSGLWNVNHVRDQVDDEFLTVMRDRMRRMS